MAPPFRPTSYTKTRGKKRTPHRDPSDPSRRRANKRKGHGSYDNDRPPIISVIRDMGEQRLWGCDRADTRTCAALIAETLPPSGALLYTDEWQSYRGGHPAMPPSAMGCTSGRAMMMGIAAVRSTATPARVRAQRSGPTCVPFKIYLKSSKLLWTLQIRVDWGNIILLKIDE